MVFYLELFLVLLGLSMLADDWYWSRQRKAQKRFVETKVKEYRSRQEAELQEWKRKNGVPSNLTML